jgi:hypothetical protein
VGVIVVQLQTVALPTLDAMFDPEPVKVPEPVTGVRPFAPLAPPPTVRTTVDEEGVTAEDV